MKIRFGATLMTLATLALLGCGGGSKAQPETFELDGSWLYTDALAASVEILEPEAFELDGSWLYLGPSDGPHTLTISNGSMAYADVDGEWSSNWTLKEYDNGLHHFQVVFESASGTYLPVGQNMSGTYVLNGAILTVQLANGLGTYSSVQSPGSCTEGGSTLIPDCRLYVKQQ